MQSTRCRGASLRSSVGPCDADEPRLRRARRRLARQRLDATVPLARLMDVRKAIFDNLSSFTNLGSQIGDTRAISALRFSPDSSMLLTGSWTGQAKLWSVPACKEIRVLKGTLCATSLA